MAVIHMIASAQLALISDGLLKRNSDQVFVHGDKPAQRGMWKLWVQGQPYLTHALNYTYQQRVSLQAVC